MARKLVEVTRDLDSAPAEPAGRHRRWLGWALGIAGGLLVLVVGAVVVFVLLTRDTSPGAFYSPPDEITAALGTIIRSEPFEAGVPDGARGWRVFYVSTDEHDRPIAVSGVVIAPTEATGEPHPVLGMGARHDRHCPRLRALVDRRATQRDPRHERTARERLGHHAD